MLQGCRKNSPTQHTKITRNGDLLRIRCLGCVFWLQGKQIPDQAAEESPAHDYSPLYRIWLIPQKLESDKKVCSYLPFFTLLCLMPRGSDGQLFWKLRVDIGEVITCEKLAF